MEGEGQASPLGLRRPCIDTPPRPHPCQILDEALKICNYIFTIIFVLESVFKLVAFGFRRFFQDR